MIGMIMMLTIINYIDRMTLSVLAPTIMEEFNMPMRVTAITPGPNNLMLLASGVNFGLRRSLPYCLGICIGFFVMLAIIGFHPGSTPRGSAAPAAVTAPAK